MKTIIIHILKPYIISNKANYIYIYIDYIWGLINLDIYMKKENNIQNIQRTHEMPMELGVNLSEAVFFTKELISGERPAPKSASGTSGMVERDPTS